MSKPRFFMARFLGDGEFKEQTEFYPCKCTYDKNGKPLIYRKVAYIKSDGDFRCMFYHCANYFEVGQELTEQDVVDYFKNKGTNND